MDSDKLNDQFEYLCKEVSLPAVTANTIAVNGHEAQGVVREQTVSVMFDSPLTITMISDRDYSTFKAVREKWFDKLAINANPNQPGGRGASQRVSYYNTIKDDITLIKLEQNGDVNSSQAFGYYEPWRATFNNAFPVSVGEIRMNSQNTDSFMEFTVAFAYENYTMDYSSFKRDALSRFVTT